MRNRAAICVVAASVAVTGCMTTPKFDPQVATTCDDKHVCAVPVTVVNCVTTIPADKSELHMSGGPVAILWYLTPASILQKYTFNTTKGVVLKVPDPYAQFPTQEAVFNDHAYLWVNRNSYVKIYDYSINIVDNGHGGAACNTLDPKIFNQ